jgi:hypothetical protein
MDKTLTLYTGPGCHLCDDARRVVMEVLPPDWQLREVSIADSDRLRERYGLRIPVIAGAGGEKGWPFSPGQVRGLIACN